MSSKQLVTSLAGKGLTQIHGLHNTTVKHLIKLREKKGYRSEQGSALVQGKNVIQELLDRNIKMRSIGFTVSKDMENFEFDPKSFPAERHFICDINNTRRILGTASRPIGNEIFAEVELPQVEFPTSPDKLLVFNRITDPGNLGTLVRTAKALGWGSAILTDHTCDMSNDKTIRASKAAVIGYAHKTVPSNQLIQYLESMHMTPVVADTMTRDIASAQSSSQLTFWNKATGEIVKTLPSRIALILSSEHHGPHQIGPNILRVSIPMHSNVESLNVASAGSILLYQLNQMLKEAQEPNRA